MDSLLVLGGNLVFTKSSAKTQVAQIEGPSNGSPSAYVAQVGTMATKQKVGVILRRGGRNNLVNLRRRWAVKGVPSDWGPSKPKLPGRIHNIRQHTLVDQ